MAVNVEDLVARLRTTVEGARSMPMSSSAVVNRSEVLELIGQLEKAIPTAFAQSHKVYSERDSVVAEGRREAERIVADGKREHERLVSDSEVYRVAKVEAEKVRAEGDRERAAMSKDLDEYVDTRLANIEITLSKTVEAVTRGRERLHGRSHFEGLDSPDEAGEKVSSESTGAGSSSAGPAADSTSTTEPTNAATASTDAPAVDRVNAWPRA